MLLAFSVNWILFIYNFFFFFLFLCEYGHASNFDSRYQFSCLVFLLIALRTSYSQNRED